MGSGGDSGADALDGDGGGCRLDGGAEAADGDCGASDGGGAATVDELGGDSGRGNDGGGDSGVSPGGVIARRASLAELAFVVFAPRAGSSTPSSSAALDSP